jgi:DNA replication and repair protein RecF
MGTMLTRLRLRDFRLFGEMVFEPDPGVNFLVGSNAQGKTSLLEAVCLLLRLQSPRTNSPSECVRFGTGGFGIDGTCGGRHLALKVANRLKHFALDSKPQVAASDYLAVARVAWIANTDLDLVRGGGSARRRFLDFLGVQTVPGYLRQLRAYERALRSRNALLREGRPRREIAAFDTPLCAAGDFLLEARARISSMLEENVSASYRAISGSGETFSIAYQPGSGLPMGNSLAASRDEDLRLRTTPCGPHRDDLALLLGGRPATTFASEGQQRSAALGLKLAQSLELARGGGSPPIYLIDDVFGELDETRRNNLLHSLPGHGQKLITATSLNWLADAPWPSSRFTLANGQLAAG